MIWYIFQGLSISDKQNDAGYFSQVEMRKIASQQLLDVFKSISYFTFHAPRTIKAAILKTS